MGVSSIGGSWGLNLVKCSQLYQRKGVDIDLKYLFYKYVSYLSLSKIWTRLPMLTFPLPLYQNRDGAFF